MGQFMEKTDTFMQKRLFAVMLGVALALATYAGDCFEGMRADNDSTHHRVLIFGDSTLDGVARWMNSSDSICPLPMARPKTVAKQFKHNERHTRKYRV